MTEINSGAIDSRALETVSERLETYYREVRSAINSGRFDFESHVTKYFSADYSEIVDSVVGGWDSLRRFWTSSAQLAAISGGKVAELALTYYHCRYLSSGHIVATASVPVEMEFPEGHTEGFFHVLTLLLSQEDGEWVIAHTHRETVQSLSDSQ